MKIKYVLVALLAMFVFLSCSEDDTNPYKCSDCVDSPEALAANDEIGKGIYKGVVVGSTGTIKINMDNEGNGNITAILVFDDQEIELTTHSTYGEGGFEGCFINEAEEISICLYISTTGGIELGSVTIPGHPQAEIELIKELSDALVLSFEGTYSGDAQGTWNMVMRLMENGNGSWEAISRGNDEDDEVKYSYGEVSDSGIMGVGDDGIVVAGEKDGDIVEGEWESNGGVASGTWKGKRTL